MERKTEFVRAGNIRLSKSGKVLTLGIKRGDVWENYTAFVADVRDVMNKLKTYCQISRIVRAE
jgi:hypothetical protein